MGWLGFSSWIQTAAGFIYKIQNSFLEILCFILDSRNNKETIQTSGALHCLCLKMCNINKYKYGLYFWHTSVRLSKHCNASTLKLGANCRKTLWSVRDNLTDCLIVSQRCRRKPNGAAADSEDNPLPAFWAQDASFWIHIVLPLVLVAMSATFWKASRKATAARTVVLETEKTLVKHH